MSFHESRCEGCPIQGRYTPMEQVGPPQAMFLVVTDRPSRAAASEGRLMTTAQLSTFANEAKRLGFTRDDFRFTPACHCPYDQDNHTTKERREIHKACRQHLLAEVESGSAHVVLPLGADATSQVYGKSTKITRVRGLASRVDGIGPPVFPLLSPGLVVKYPQNAPLFRADMDSFGRFVDADYRADHASAMDDDSVEYEFIDDLQFLIDAKPDVLCFDTETTGLRWYKTGQDVRTYKPAIHKGSAVFSPRFQILTMQFCIEEGKSYMLVWDHPERPVSLGDKPRLRNQLRQLLCRPETLVVGQNTKFDNVALWATEGIRFRIGGDTQMLTTLLDENQMEKNLDVQTKIHVEEMAGYADRFNVSVDKSRMWETRLAELMPYGCGDTDAGFRLYGKLEAEVAEDEKLWAHYARVSLPGLNAFAAVEMRGMYVDDLVALPEFKTLMAREVEEQRIDLLGQVPREVRRDVIADFCSKAGNKGPDGPVRALAFSRGAFLKEVLFTHPKGFRLRPQVFTKSTAKLRDESLRQPSTSAKDHLPYFFDSCPFTQQLAEFVKDHSLLTKSVISFEKKYIVGRKVRPTYHLHKAVTGRTASEDPNGQNFPKRGPRAKAYRTMFVAPPGHYVCENDLSQAELRIAAAMSGDRTMIDIYCSGGDIHKSTAAIVLGITMEAFERLPKEEQKEARQKAKACIAAGQLVLTRDRGLVPIENILLTDLVWDGVEWVHHEGVVYKGYREVITHEGLTATPDHRVYTEGRSNPVQFGALASSLSNERIAIGAIGTVGVRYSNPGPYRDGCKVAQIRNHALHTLQSISKDTHRQCTGGEDDQLQVPKGDKKLQHALLPQCGPGSSQDWREVRRYQAAHAEPELRLLQGLRCARDQVAVREQESLYSVCTGDYATDRLRGHGARPGGQQRPLRPWKSSLANESAELTEQTQLPTYSVPGQEHQCTGPTRQYRSGPPDVQVRGKLDLPTICGEGVDGGSDSGPRLAHVYDIVNAGPRHRFTVSGAVVSNCNFGFLYGMGWRKFIGYAKTQYNVVFTEQEAQRVRAGFFNRYKSLDAWHMSMREFARRHKYVRSFSGRIRHLPMIDSSEESVRGEAERQAINSPVQEFGSSLGVMAMGRLSEDIDPKYLEIVGFVHDALVYYTPKEYVEWAMKTVKRYMQSNPLQEWFNLRLPIPIVSDVGFGTNLGEIHECPGFSLEERFDFGTLRDKDGALLIEVPRQRIPPNNGLLQRSAYTLPEDLEDENAPIPVVRRSRLVRGVVSSAAILRVERSKKQMVINRRNIERRREQEREVRSTVVFAGRRRHAPVA